jgi:hypothetical protein
MVKGFNEAWRNSGRKESEISIRYQYYASGDTKEKLLHEGCKNCQKMKKSKKTGAFTDFLPIHTITLACLLAITL